MRKALWLGCSAFLFWHWRFVGFPIELVRIRNYSQFVNDVHEGAVSRRRQKIGEPTMRFAQQVVLVVVASIMSALAVTAGDLPAVSGPNGKLSVEGGTFDDQGAGIALGSFAVPLGPSFGLQADGALGSIDGDVMGGGGLHLFTRDPSSYLLGVYGSYHTWDSIDIWRLAGEGELYLGRFTLSGLAGYESVEVPSTVGDLLVLTPDDKHFFGQFDASYYITDDFKVTGGYRYLNESSFAAAGAEYLIRGRDVPMSLFARGNFGDGDYTSVTGGLKIYLGSDPNKSLIDRNRRDDPENYLPVFPKLATSGGTNYCTAGPSPMYQVSSPTPCVCPSGTPRSGQGPKYISALGGFYTCGNPV